MKTFELNLNPGVNWEKEDVVLMSKSGIVRSTTGYKSSSAVPFSREKIEARVYPKLSENWIFIPQGYGQSAVDINIVHSGEGIAKNYISIIPYHCRNCGKASDFEDAVAEKLSIIRNNADYYYDSNRPVKKEIRIYADRKMVEVLAYDDRENDGAVRAWVFTDKREDERCSSFYSGNGWDISRFFKKHITKEKYSSSTGYTIPTVTFKKEIERNFDTAEEEGFIISLWNDEDCYAQAKSNSVKNHYLAQWLYGNICSYDLPELEKNHEMLEPIPHCFEGFKQSTIQRINEFFGVFSEENAAYKKLFDSKYTEYESNTRNIEKGITGLAYLENWTCLNESKLKRAIKQVDFGEDMLKTITFKGADTVCWDRVGDNYVTCAYEPSEEWGNYMDFKKAVFVYDLKNQKRKAFIVNSNDQIQTLQSRLSECIDKYFYLSRVGRTYYGYGWRSDDTKKSETKFYVADGKTTSEIFKGTNVGWIADNTDAREGRKVELHYKARHYCCDVITTDIVSELKTEDLNEGILLILATTGERVLEQLLKSKLFNIYAAMLSTKTVSSKYSKMTFFDISKKYKQEYSYKIAFNGKGKNLKEIFGLSMNHLRAIDAKISFNKKENKFTVPDIHWMRKFGLTDEDIAHMDAKNFEKVVSIGCKNLFDQGYNVDEKLKRVGEALVNLSIKDKLTFLDNIPNADKYETYVDYIMMRDNMLDLAKKRPLEISADEKHYPLRPGKAVKFIAFIPGMTMCSSKWNRAYRNAVENTRAFVEGINTMYGPEIAKEWHRDDSGEISGVQIRMDQMSHITYLHDELSAWYSLYQDEAKEAGFQRAIRRVLPLEWEDEKSGLCVIAPKAISELQNEGRVLSHCVAGYVDPIINGTENVVFIRRTDMKGEPYFTMDVVGGRIRQVHCYRNGNPTESGIEQAYANSGLPVYDKPFDIIGFLKKWVKAMKKAGHSIDEGTIKESYSALCATR